MRSLRGGLLLVLSLVHCGPATTDTATTSTSAGTSEAGTSTTASETGRAPTATSATSESSESSAPTVTTGDADPCTVSDQCSASEACVLVPCSLQQGPGCDAFHCSDACGWPFDDTSVIRCVDDRGCCQDALCIDGQCDHPSRPETTGDDTAGLVPCAASSDCPGDGHCLLKPCDLVRNEPGCGEFHCYDECSIPFDDTAFWTCADDAACCGYTCLAGQCTEMFETDT